MNKKNKLKAILAFIVALTFIMPVSAVFANDEGTSTVQPVMSILPSTQTKNIGDTFTVDVYIDPEDYLVSGANVNLLSFNPSVIQATSPIAVTFTNFFPFPKMQGYGTVDNVNGKITGIYELTMPFVGIGTEGTWLSIEFTAIGTGTSSITMDDVGLPDEIGNKIEPITVNNGEVIVTGEVFYTLDISVDGSGTTDPIPGTHTYSEGAVVDLEAIPDLGWSFDHWVGDVADPNSDVTNITMNENKAVTAYFTEEDCYTLTVSTHGDGIVNVDPYKTCYLYGESVNLTAVPDDFWEFDVWSGDLTGSKNPETIIMDDDKAVTAHFTEEEDTTPPETNHTLKPPEPDGDNGWYTVPVEVTLNATDEGSGVASTWYRWFDYVWRWYPPPFTVSGDKVHTVEYFSIDRANNVEEINETIIKIDTTPPVTIHTFDGVMGDEWFIDDVTVTLSARDVTSGVNRTMYKMDNGDLEKYNGSFVITEDGTYNISYYSVDLAGHIEETNEATFKILRDIWPPVTTHILSGIIGDNGWYVSDVMVTLEATDEGGAGVCCTRYKIDNDEWEKYTGNPFYVKEDGPHIIKYYSVDNVGNNESDESVKEAEFKIDKTTPTIDLVAEGSGTTWLLTATVSDETSGIAEVEFYVAGEYLGNDTSEPYEWEYTGASSGEKAQAIAYDNAGNLQISNPPTTDSQSQDQNAFIGWTFIIGRITNMEESENIITAQATWLRYIEISPTGINAGFVKMKSVEFSSHNILGRRIRSFGRMLLVFGVFKGGITIENE